MRNVLFVCAAESMSVPDDLTRLSADCARHVTIAQPPREARTREAMARWLDDTAAKLDLVVVTFCNAPAATFEAPAIPDGAAGVIDAPAARDAVRADRLVLDRAERVRLLERAPTVVAVSRADPAEVLPPDLARYRRFDLAADDGYDALLCRIVHKPVASSDSAEPASQGFQAAFAVFRILMGVVATIVGNLDKTQDLLVSSLGDGARLVHYVMAVVVVVLMISGALALLWPVVEPLARRASATLGPRGRVAKWLSLAAVAALVVAFAVIFFPPSPSVAGTVDRHLREWTRRIQESQMPSGAIREHHDKGGPQAWVTAQALTGLLAVEPSKMTVDAYGSAIAYLRRTRIGNYALAPGAREMLISTAQLGTVDLTRFSSRLPTIAFAYDSLVPFAAAADVRAKGEFPGDIVRRLDAQQGALLTGTPNAEGWGYFSQFDWGVTEIAGWVAVASAQVVQHREAIHLSNTDVDAAREVLRSAVVTLLSRQTADGGFSPIFDVTHPNFARTYSTVMAIWGLTEATAPGVDALTAEDARRADDRIRDAVRWLGLTALDDGWKVNPGNPASGSFLGLTAQTLCVLGLVRTPIDATSEARFQKVRQHLLANSGTWLKRSLTENDRIHDSDRYLLPTTYVTEGSTFVWYPWMTALLNSMSQSTQPQDAQQARTARRLYDKLSARAGEFSDWVETEYNYAAAESLIAFGWLQPPLPPADAGSRPGAAPSVARR